MDRSPSRQPRAVEGVTNRGKFDRIGNVIVGRHLQQFARHPVGSFLDALARFAFHLRCFGAWWTSALHEHGFDDTVVGDTIRRDDIFALANDGMGSRAAALTLLWNSLAWGSGGKRRNNKGRITSVARDPDRTGALLQEAAASRIGGTHLPYEQVAA